MLLNSAGVYPVPFSLQLQRSYSRFLTFYASQHNGRKLNWLYQLSKVRWLGQPWCHTAQNVNQNLTICAWKPSDIRSSRESVLSVLIKGSLTALRLYCALVPHLRCTCITHVPAHVHVYVTYAIRYIVIPSCVASYVAFGWHLPFTCVALVMSGLLSSAL